MTVTTEERPVRPAIDPRIRERRIEVIREAGRRRLRVTLIIASAVVALGLAYLAVHSPLLDVDRIRITGARREPVAELVAATGVHKGAPMLWVDSGRIAHRLERLPWIAHARVERDFPGTIAIKVTEYVPTVFVRVAADRVALVASTGRVIAFAATPPAGAIEVTGDPAPPGVGSLLSPTGVASAALALPARLRAEVTAIEVQPAATLTLRNGGPQIRLGSFAEMRSKGVSALAVLEQLTGRSCQYIDVAAPQAPVSRCNN